MKTTDLFERRVVISGIGQSEVARQLGASAFSLTIDAIIAAVADAGLSMHDIDGFATYPGGGRLPYVPYAAPNMHEIQDALGITTRWRSGQTEGFGMPIWAAAQAVAAGVCRHVVSYRSVKDGTMAKSLGGHRPFASVAEAEGPLAWQLPIGALSILAQMAPIFQRYMYEYGMTREQLGWLAVVQRSHAALYPDAVFKSPLSLDDYLNGRMISSPISLFDCDMPVDVGAAMVVSSREAVADLRAPVGIEAMATASNERSLYLQGDDVLAPAPACAEEMWRRTDLRPVDLDVAQLYDGISFEAIFWLEALGICGRGEAGSFIEGGSRISLGGEIPVNTWGGQLSSGRIHAAYGHFAEAVRQLRGEAGGRQVPDAEVSVVTVGTGYETGCAVLTKS
jgi:acetyl-CoA acetyltransferase